MLASIKPGDLVGKTRIKRRIGQGSMGSVFLGHHLDLDIEVAVKLLNVDLSSDDKARERFLREGQLQAKLDHPNIVRVHALGNDDGSYYLAMEFVDGVNLGDVVGDKALPQTQALKVLWDLAQALKYIHAKGLIHRDIKPSNVMIRKKNSSAVLMDFGLVRPKQGSKLTAVGTIMGTANYMPPEQANPRGGFGPISPQSDLYSLGATFYKLLTGKAPYAANNPIETIMKLLSEPLTPPREINAKIAPEVEDICLWCMEKEQKNRVDTADALLQALVAFTKGRYKIRPLRVPPPVTPKPTPKPKPTVVGPKIKPRKLPTIEPPVRPKKEPSTEGRHLSSAEVLARKAAATAERARKTKERAATRSSSGSRKKRRTKASGERRKKSDTRRKRESTETREREVASKTSSATVAVWILSGILFASIVVLLVYRILGD